MMKKFFGNIYLLTALVLITIMACQKDYSYEGGILNSNAIGTLLDANGNCQDVTVKGYYLKDTAVTAKNYIVVKATFTSAGKYKLHSDTVNGVWFTMKDSSFTYGGVTQSITLKANGKPKAIGTFTNKVYLLNNFCLFNVIVSPYKSPVSATETDYFPMVVDSKWVYDTNTNSGTKDTVRFVVSNNIVNFNGKPYTSFISNARDTTSYWKDGSGKYYCYVTSLRKSFGLVFDYKCLDDRLNVGDSWITPDMTAYIKIKVDSIGKYNGKDSTFKVTHILVTTILIRCTIDQKNITYKLPIQSLDSIIVVKEEFLTRDNSGNIATLGVLPDYQYYAKGVGLVLYQNDNQPNKVIRKARYWELK
jgi:hypothetical protein